MGRTNSADAEFDSSYKRANAQIYQTLHCLHVFKASSLRFVSYPMSSLKTTTKNNIHHNRADMS